MSRQLSADDIFDTVEIDLWGNTYTLLPMTRSVAAKFDKAQDAVAALTDDAGNDKIASTLIGIVDVVLGPTEDAPSAKSLLSGLWKEDKLGLDWLQALVDALGDEAVERRRPTSGRMNGG